MPDTLKKTPALLPGFKEEGVSLAACIGDFIDSLCASSQPFLNQF